MRTGHALSLLAKEVREVKKIIVVKGNINIIRIFAPGGNTVIPFRPQTPNKAPNKEPHKPQTR